nr:auxin responsive family-like protein [Pinus koraiensis]
MTMDMDVEAKGLKLGHKFVKLWKKNCTVQALTGIECAGRGAGSLSANRSQ